MDALNRYLDAVILVLGFRTEEGKTAIRTCLEYNTALHGLVVNEIEAAALSVTKVRGESSIPKREEIVSFLKIQSSQSLNPTFP